MTRPALPLFPLVASLALIALPALAAPSPVNDPPPPPLQRASIADDAGPSLFQGMKGLEFSLPTSGIPAIGVTYFVAPDAAIRLDLSFNFAFSNPDGSGASADLALGLAYRLYLTRVGRLHVFAAPEVSFGRQGVGAGAHAEFFDIGGQLGVQYFFTDHFNIGGAVGVGLNITNIGGPGNSSVGAALVSNTSNLFAGFYW